MWDYDILPHPITRCFCHELEPLTAPTCQVWALHVGFEGSTDGWICPKADHTWHDVRAQIKRMLSWVLASSKRISWAIDTYPIEDWCKQRILVFVEFALILPLAMINWNSCLAPPKSLKTDDNVRFKDYEKYKKLSHCLDNLFLYMKSLAHLVIVIHFFCLNWITWSPNLLFSYMIGSLLWQNSFIYDLQFTMKIFCSIISQ